MKKLFASVFVVVFALLAICSGGPASAVDDNPIPTQQRQWAWFQPECPSVMGSNPDKKVMYCYTYSAVRTDANNVPHVGVQKVGGRPSLFCQSEKDCAAGDYSEMRAFGLFKRCAESNVAPCVESFEYSTGSSDWREAVFLKETNGAPNESDVDSAMRTFPSTLSLVKTMGWDKKEFPALPPSASGSLLFRLPGAINSAGRDTYALTATFFANGTNTGHEFRDAQVTDFDIGVMPTLVDESKSGAYLLGSTGDSSYLIGSRQLISSQNLQDLTYLDKDSVGFNAQFPANLSLRLKLKLNKSLGGWFHGRLEKPSISVADASGEANTVVIEGQPTRVPLTSFETDPFDKGNEDFLAYLKSWCGNCSYYDDLASHDRVSGGFSMGWWEPRLGLNMYPMMSRFLNPKAKGYSSQFSIKRLATSLPCMSDTSSFQGLLTTNATAYQPDLPNFKGGQLTYKVAGVHYDYQGEVFQGSYNFIMRSSVAKCLYGFKGSSPISGTVSVTSSDGQENVAYTNVSDRDGWLKLTAEGFTFSSPIIAAKLTQQSDSVPGASGETSSGGQSATGQPAGKPTASAPAAAKKVTITCVKGKTVKKVTAVAPKCPAGYKKK